MVHCAIDPSNIVEDVIYMLNAQPVIEKGLQVAKIPVMLSKTGEMQTMQWYYYDGKSVEPHHDIPFLIIAIDLK